MGYLPNFDEDVFISYAHFDDDKFGAESCGWVTQLHEDLEQRVRIHLGADVRLWRDCNIRNNDEFTNKILNRLVHTATFLCVLSPGFLQRDWCKKELESFASHAETRSGILFNEERSRIFKVEKVPVERTALPPPMQGTKTYKFYQPDPGQPKKTIELRPLFGPDYLRRYFEALNDLAKDIADLLKGMLEGASTPKTGPVVYIAETTRDLDDKLGEIRRDLSDRNYVVLPDGDLPDDTEAYKKRVRECLEKAVLSVHLVGSNYAATPEGETKSKDWIQHDLAMERNTDPNFVRLIWMPRDVAPTDQRQRDFIKYLQDDAGVQRGADLLTGNIEDLKTVIHDRLDDIQKPKDKKEVIRVASDTVVSQPGAATAASAAVPKRAPGQPLRVYIMCDAADRKSPTLTGLRKYLLSQGCEPMLPTIGEKETDSLQIHIDNLSLCDGYIIFYGQGSPAWYDAKIRDIRKYLSGRLPPVSAKAIYIALPKNDHKEEVEMTLEAPVLCEDTAFSADQFAAFVQSLRTAT